jgi:PAS domain-containing protein
MLVDRQGAIILDAQRQIQVITPVAEDLLGWESHQVVGMECPLVFDCRDSQGRSMCDRCGFADALRRQEITQPQPLEMADAFGGRRRVTMNFWYLPPAGNIYHPRVMAVLSEAPRTPNGDETQ